jgi:ABC-type antimicrobial peptide transport system permease subunit
MRWSAVDLGLGIALIGVVFGSLAGLAAFTITYNEYQRHFTTPRRAALEALKTAGFTLLVFLLLTILIAGALARLRPG